MLPPQMSVIDQAIIDKVSEGSRLSFEEGVALYETSDLFGLGRLADRVRTRLNGRQAYFNVNRHINYTNVCVIDCQLCQGAYARKPGEAGGYTMSLDQVFEFAEQKYGEAVTEFHIVGGLNPELPFAYYLDLLRGLRERFPGVHLKAFTMVELDFFTKITRRSLEWVIEQLAEAGMGSCPGGGAEIFAERARPLIAGHKISADRWLECARAVHGAGLASNATMLYGHIETIPERVDHLIRLRELQDETGGFNCFIPLAFHPENTVYEHLPPTTGTEDLKTIAVSRLMLDNFSHIKAYWVTITPSLAQIALRFGADDLDGTIIEERIIHGAGGRTSPGLSRGQIEQLIRDAGCEPVERDTLYNAVRGQDAPLATKG
jgi:aminodeoxyfutalosine synthase